MALLFDSRVDAGRRLATQLEGYRGRNPLVLAIPRGAVEMGAVIAQALGGDLDVVLVRKLGSPSNPEFAIGSVDENGWTYIAPYAAQTGADEAYLAKAKAAELALLARRRAQYTPGQHAADARGRIAIVVDDGIATGASMIAALHAVRGRQPARLVCAVPVAAAQSLEQVGRYADEVVCLGAPREFQAVSQFYRFFPQVRDDEVVSLLARQAGTEDAS